MKRGTRLGSGYVDVTVDGDKINPEIIEQFDAAGDGVEKAGEEHGERYEEGFDRSWRARMRGKVAKLLGKEMEEESGKVGDDSGKNTGKHFLRTLKDVLDGADGNLGDRLADRIADRMSDRLELSIANIADDLENRLASVSGNRGGGGGRGNGRPGNGRDDHTLGNTVGRLFGAGSRNNFLNFFGKTLGNIVDLTEKVRKGASGLFTTFMKGFTEAGEGASFLQKSMAGIQELGSAGASRVAAGFSALAESGPVAAVAIVAITVALSALVSVASALLAILTALTATIVSGLVGALAVASAGVSALVAAGGLAVLAFISLDKAQKAALGHSFKPLIDDLKGVGKTVIDNLSAFDQTNNKLVTGMGVFDLWSKNLQKAVNQLQPLAKVMGAAFGQAGASLTSSLSGKGVKNFLASLTKDLPSITTHLSSALGGFLNGLLGIFAAIMPQVREFSKYLDDVATTFNKWANSTKGQNTIASWTDRAVDSFKSLWNFTREFFGYLSDILFSKPAQQAGNGLFDGLADSFARFRKNISDGKLESWFQNAIKFGGQLMTVFTGIAHVIGALNNSGILNLVGKGLHVLGDALEVIAFVAKPLINVLGTHGGLGLALTVLNAPLGIVAATVLDLTQNLDKLADAGAWVGRQLGKLNPFGGNFLGLGGDTEKKTSAFMSTLKGVVSAAGRAAKGMSDYAGTLDRVSGNTTKATRAMIIQKAQQDGILGTANRLGISSKTLASAVLGQKGAIDKVSDAWKKNKTVLDALSTGQIKKWLSDQGVQLQGAQKKVKEFQSIMKNVFNVTPSSKNWQKQLGLVLGGEVDLSKKQIKVINGILAKAGDARVNGDPLLRSLRNMVSQAEGVASNGAGKIRGILDGINHTIQQAFAGVTRSLANLGKRAAEANRNKNNGGGGGNDKNPRLATGPSRGSSVSPRFMETGGTDALLNSLGMDERTSAAAAKKAVKHSRKYWEKIAKALIKNGPSVAAQIRNSVVQVNRDVASAIRDASRATSVDDVAQGLSGTISSIKSSVQETVNTAQSALNDAANKLLDAKGTKAYKAALKNFKKRRKDLNAALKAQKNTQKAAAILAKQEKTTGNSTSALHTLAGLDSSMTPAQITAGVNSIMSTLKKSNTTLADFASVRAALADKIDAANQALADAISLRDDYMATVSDSIKTFGALTTAQAQTLNGVEQALTAGDITSNLQDKLAKIKTFQSNLQILLAEGLSNDAYKQLVDAGVDNGSAYVDALVQGGAGAVSQVNDLVSQINAAGDQLGTEASNRLYQAGVDAAQGLVDGLTSLSSQLDSAATKLGNSIAAAIAKALGIHSPSRVLRSMMGGVGDGAVLGLGDQETKVGNAATRLAEKINVSPEVAAYASRQGQPAVSGNSDDPRFRDLHVHTPTEDPEAVAMEVLNEVTGRL